MLVVLGGTEHHGTSNLSDNSVTNGKICPGKICSGLAELKILRELSEIASTIQHYSTLKFSLVLLGHLPLFHIHPSTRILAFGFSQ